MRKKPELLAPAGDMEKLRMAVLYGADAVYLAGTSFGMRSFAGNFTADELPEAVRFAHDHGVRVHVTVNTMPRNDEVARLPEHLERLNDLGVDALILADLGAFTLAGRYAPRCERHISTQQSIANYECARAWYDLGAKRVVLAREVSLQEIREMRAKLPPELELETFCHGAMCVSYSGRCLLSNYMTGRDSNRGACAQPCRLPYGVNGPCRGGHPLSLKDANLSAYLAEMEAMGVACLKLEGRMKRPEYVAVVTGIYRRLLDEKRRPTAEESRRLEQAFSRSGFTDGYWLGKKGPQMFGTRPENAPEPKELFAKTREMYENGRENRKILVNLRLSVRRGEPVRLGGACTVHGGAAFAMSTGAVPEEARNRAVTAEELRQRLSKTGGTVFTADRVEIELDEGLTIPASAVNGLRRELLEELAKRRMDIPPRRKLPALPLPDAPEGGQAMRFTCSVQKAEQVTAALLAEKPAVVYVPVEELERLDPELDWGETELCAVLPRIFRTADETPLRQLLEQHPEASAVAIGNLGHLPIARGLNRTLRGDFGLNIFNSRALLFWQGQELASATVSFELRWQQVRDLRKYLPCEAIIYGRLPLMVTENCVTRCSVGCTHGAGSVLTDRTGARFPVLCGYGCRCEIQNSKTLFLADKPEMRRCGLTYGRLRFTTETPEQCVQVLQRYQNGGNWTPEDLTRGLFYRGVE